jgi:hypothetical protein
MPTYGNGAILVMHVPYGGRIELCEPYLSLVRRMGARWHRKGGRWHQMGANQLVHMAPIWFTQLSYGPHTSHGAICLPWSIQVPNSSCSSHTANAAPIWHHPPPTSQMAPSASHTAPIQARGSYYLKVYTESRVISHCINVTSDEKRHFGIIKISVASYDRYNRCV